MGKDNHKKMYFENYQYQDLKEAKKNPYIRNKFNLRNWVDEAEEFDELEQLEIIHALYFK